MKKAISWIIVVVFMLFTGYTVVYNIIEYGWASIIIFIIILLIAYLLIWSILNIVDKK